MSWNVQNKWKIRLQLTKPVTWPPLIWGVVCGAAASGIYFAYNRYKSFVIHEFFLIKFQFKLVCTIVHPLLGRKYKMIIC